ncbi:hypothetical protein N7520_008771 [Penicillium odoratum]|uniref:uncharacterized protein n=1 Tax=Penicillium odoratum TaxID=1167516 RepID=UPI002547139E|nr:uncharacterized protein N7520_008771 [Penicillium odoratum]KAJ5751854.1 hypothetical protein N7520_008771 [Penicillium odoratum]
MADDIDSTLYRLIPEELPETMQTSASEDPTTASNVSAEEGPRRKRPRRRRDDPEPDHSSLVREEQQVKQATSDRCRHACDRCKYKKTRCTAVPGDPRCLLCSQLGKDCYVTDRVTNETYKRGEPAMMKRKIAELEDKIFNLEAEIDDYAKEKSAREPLVMEDMVIELEEKVAGLEGEVEVSIMENSKLRANIVALEDENALIREENFRWREQNCFLDR